MYRDLSTNKRRIDIDWGNVGMTLFVTAFVLFMVYVLAWAVIEVGTSAVCLEHGWYTSSVAWDFKRYCSREENEYEIVRPLNEILEMVE